MDHRPYVAVRYRDRHGLHCVSKTWLNVGWHGTCTIESFIDGCTSYKSESIALHEKSACHKAAVKIDCNKSQATAGTDQATKALLSLNKAHMGKLRLLFRNGHALAKHVKSFRDFKWLCQLDEVKVSQTRQICSRDEFITIMVVRAWSSLWLQMHWCWSTKPSATKMLIHFLF